MKGRAKLQAGSLGALALMIAACMDGSGCHSDQST